MITRPTTPIELFYSYSHKDERLRNELEKHLSLLMREGYIATWHDRKIVPGRDWEGEIDEHLNSAQIILLLISADFMASDYCYDIEVKRAIERHNAGEACVIPIILRKVDWHSSPMGNLQALPTDGKPVASWSSRDAAFYDVVQGIRKAINALPNSKPVLAVESHTRQNLQSHPGGEENISGLDRPATAFISYAREDTDEVKYLQQQMRVRGVQEWHYINKVTPGIAKGDRIVQAIEQEADAFVMYITRQSLILNTTWNVELPAALRRRDQDPAFAIVPVFRNITFEELEQFCAVHGDDTLTQMYLSDEAVAKRDEPVEKYLKFIAQQVLEATFRGRLHRVGADRNRKYEASLCLQTHVFTPQTDSLDLDLDWMEFFPGKDEPPTEEVCETVFLPALDDVKRVLSKEKISNRVHIFLKAHIPTALALGASLPEVAGFKLLIDAYVGTHSETWSTEEPISTLEPLQHTTFEKTGDANVAVVEIGIPSATASDVENNLKSLGISYKHHIRYEVPDGSDRRVRDSAHARAISFHVGQELRRLYGREGVTHVHLFAAIPVALAVMIGHQINAMSAITLYHFTIENRRYTPMCTLGKRRN